MQNLLVRLNSLLNGRWFARWPSEPADFRPLKRG